MLHLITLGVSVVASFQVKNLRSVEDSGVVQLRKITVLVGKNSSGKSTILRTLPLLRQSVEQRTKGPILWYGRLVDFGDFKNAVRGGDVARGIILCFETMLSPKRRTTVRTISPDGEWQIPSRQGLRVRVELTLGRSPDDRVGHVRRLKADIGGDEIVLDFDRSGQVATLAVMGQDVHLVGSDQWWVTAGNIVPSLVLLEQNSYQVDENEYESFHEPALRPFGSLIDRKLALISHGNTSLERLSSVGSKLLFGSEADFFKQLVVVPGVTSSLQHRLEQIGPRAPEVKDLRRAVMLRHLTGILRAIDAEVTKFARSVRYIEPVRANAERYYREQDLAVDDIDSRGANTAVFLSSLDFRSLAALQDWMVENFGFKVEVESATGHIQIKISEGSSPARNIADLGFGYSQLLPIILQLWRSSRPVHGESPPTLAIEQPELHLHPHFQALLADVVVATAISRKGSIFIETHSDHFVNRLGALVAEGRVRPEDIQVLVVTDDGFGDSVALKVNFDSEGTLSDNWPVGFFTPSPRA